MPTFTRVSATSTACVVAPVPVMNARCRAGGSAMIAATSRVGVAGTVSLAADGDGESAFGATQAIKRIAEMRAATPLDGAQNGLTRSPGSTRDGCECSIGSCARPRLPGQGSLLL